MPCKKYKHLSNPINGFKKGEGGYRFLNEQFTGRYCEKEYVKRLRTIEGINLPHFAPFRISVTEFGAI